MPRCASPTVTDQSIENNRALAKRSNLHQVRRSWETPLSINIAARPATSQSIVQAKPIRQRAEEAGDIAIPGGWV